MAKNQIHFSVREGTGKSVTRKLRASGKIPGVVYGRGEETYPVTLDTEEFNELISNLRGKLMITELVPQKGEPFRVVIKSIQRHPLTEEFLNIDFQKIHPGELLHVSIPIIAHGTPIGLKTGGLLDNIRYEVDVRGPVSKLPSHIDIDVTPLELGDAIRIDDLDIPEGVEVLDPPQAVVVTVATPRRVVEVEAVAEGEEGEVAEGEEGVEGAEGKSAAEGDAKDKSKAKETKSKE
jgi:large subunit ribosomal protein L25